MEKEDELKMLVKLEYQKVIIEMMMKMMMMMKKKKVKEKIINFQTVMEPGHVNNQLDWGDGDNQEGEEGGNMEQGVDLDLSYKILWIVDETSYDIEKFDFDCDLVFEDDLDDDQFYV
ncbi:MAG: hypothetical protein EZS28_005812 [Streblomastix strix]|uniref:Uncharacterized protein n=1 Tax=Streblomastix strix TaxID=222440 RepID=A0A5J4WUG0_9EUKA|nr:MAG: hypothetical protein EZS28_005812 [Streblomastix strix]